MIWRPRYQDKILDPVSLPPIAAISLTETEQVVLPDQSFLIGAFEESAAPELGMWRKLVASALQIPVLTLWAAVSREFVESATPRSLWPQTYLTQDLAWKILLPLDSSKISFAVATNSTGNHIVFIGLPTEDGLDRLVQFLA